MSGAPSFGPACDRHWPVHVGGWFAGPYAGLFVLLLALLNLLILVLIAMATKDSYGTISRKPILG